MDTQTTENFFLFEQDDLLIKSMPIMQELRKNGLFCDIVVKIGDKEIPAHRNVLAATIPYFHKMLTSEDAETKQIEFIIKGMDPSAIEALIDFSYSGKIKIDPRNLQKLMSVAHFFQLNQVKDACAVYLKSEIQADNVFGIMKLANSLNCSQLQSIADEFLNENFEKIAESNDFLMLKFEELKKLIENDGLTCLEEIVFESAMKWIKHEEAERTSHLPEILSKIRLHLVLTEYLVNRVNTEELIWSSLECLRIVNKAQNDHLLQETKLTPKSRKFSKLSHFLVPIKYESKLKFYNVLKNEWLNEEEPLIKGRSQSTILSLESKAFVIGGINEKKHSLDIFDLETRKWSKGKNMITGRSWFGATTLNDSIYVCGGLQNLHRLSSVECYSVKGNSWKSVAPMTTDRSSVGVTSLNGFIYAIGGCNNRGSLNSCEKYDPTSNTWILIKPLLNKGRGFGVAELKNKIYVCGGYVDGINSKSCEVYDPSTNTWSSVAPMNKERSYFSLTSFNGKLYAIDDAKLTVEVYSPETNTWEFLNQD